MLKLGRVTKVKVLFLVLVFVFNFDLFKFSAAILEKGLFMAFVNTWCITFEDNSSHILVKLHTSNGIYELSKNNSAENCLI